MSIYYALLNRCQAGMTLPKALQQALQCPLLGASSACAVSPAMHARRQRAQRPVWAERGEDCSETFYTIRLVNGEQRVVKKSLSAARTSKKCAYAHTALFLVDHEGSPPCRNASVS